MGNRGKRNEYNFKEMQIILESRQDTLTWILASNLRNDENLQAVRSKWNWEDLNAEVVTYKQYKESYLPRRFQFPYVNYILEVQEMFCLMLGSPFLSFNAIILTSF